MLAYYDELMDLDHVIAIFQGDDMGFRTGTLVAPRDLRMYFLPWLKRLSDAVHSRGLPYFLHSCGNVAAIMEDLVVEVEIDAKHSYEDAIIPVEEFQLRYGDRIGVLGGLDLNILSGAAPDDVRQRTRALIETCGPRGRYAVGSGNSVPSYVPVANYLAMVDEALVMSQSR
jgi:uroporphyrinogen decarboxylase